MNIVFPDQGLVAWLSAQLSLGVVLRLFTNNFTITRSTLTTDLTEAAWTGYAPSTYGTLNWSISLLGHIAMGVGSPTGFSNSSGAPVTAYGWYFTDLSNTYLMAAGQFDGAPITINDGDTKIVIPALGDISHLLTSP